MKVRLAVCVFALSTTAGIATACPDYGKAASLLAKASGAHDVAVEQCAIVAGGAWAIAARDATAHHLALVGGDAGLLGDAPLDDATVFAIRPVDLDSDGTDELAVETRTDGAWPHDMLHVLRRDRGKLAELVALPIAFVDSGTTCNGTWLVHDGAIVVMGDGGSGTRGKVICQAGSTRLGVANGKLVQTKLDASASTVLWTRHFRDQACDCTTSDCAHGAADALADWQSRHASKLSDAQNREVTQLTDQLAGCKSIAGATPDALANPRVGEGMAAMEKFELEMCACKDTKCAQKVSDEMSAWSQRQAKTMRTMAKMTDEQVKRATALGEQMGECMQKAMRVTP